MISVLKCQMFLLVFLTLLRTRYVQAFFPAIPYMTLPYGGFAGMNQPLYLVRPPIYATGVAPDQVAAYGGYKMDFFYATAPPPPATPAPAAAAPAVAVAPTAAASPTGAAVQNAVAADNSGGGDTKFAGGDVGKTVGAGAGKPSDTGSGAGASGSTAGSGAGGNPGGGSGRGRRSLLDVLMH